MVKFKKGCRFGLMKLTPKGGKVALVEKVSGSELVKVKGVYTKKQGQKELKRFCK